MSPRAKRQVCHAGSSLHHSFHGAHLLPTPAVDPSGTLVAPAANSSNYPSVRETTRGGSPRPHAALQSKPTLLFGQPSSVHGSGEATTAARKALRRPNAVPCLDLAQRRSPCAHGAHVDLASAPRRRAAPPYRRGYAVLILMHSTSHSSTIVGAIAVTHTSEYPRHLRYGWA